MRLDKVSKVQACRMKEATHIYTRVSCNAAKWVQQASGQSPLEWMQSYRPPDQHTIVKTSSAVC